MNLLRAEWAKLWSVRRWTLGLLAVIGLTVGLSSLAAAGSSSNVNEHPDFVLSPDNKPVADAFSFAHQSLTGDGSITARVASQKDSHEWAAAGIMMKASLQPGSAYVSLFATPKHGVQMQSNFGDLTAGSTGPGYLKLTRTGNTVVGYESTDGITWTEVGSAAVTLPSTIEAGFFVNSPAKIIVERSAGMTGVGGRPTRGEAKFENVRLEPGGTKWTSTTLSQAIGIEGKVDDPTGELTGQDGSFSLNGSGKIGPHGPDDDTIQTSLFGIIAGIIALAAVGVLFITSEYKRGMIRTTFALSPRRERVLLAKATVLGITAFFIGLVASVLAILITRPLQRSRGFGPPAFPDQSILDTQVLRAVLLTSVFAAAISLFALGLGAIVRHSAAAISTVLSLVILPAIISTLLPMPAGQWLLTLTPAAGFSTQRAKPTTDTLVEAWSAISPWTGIAVVCAYAAAALAGAAIVQRRRDV